MALLYESLAWVYKMVITLVIAVVVVVCIGSVLQNNLNTIEIQKELLLHRILYTPSGLWYTDSDGTVHTGVLNAEQFDTAVLQQQFIYPAGYGGARLTLRTSDQQTRTAFINEQSFLNIAQSFSAGITNGGSVETHFFPVVVRETTGNEVNGWLIVEIAMPHQT